MCSSNPSGLRLLYFLLLLTSSGIAQTRQRNFNKQLTFSIENDLFAFRGTDGYYTSGLFAEYSYVRKKNKPGVIKTIDNIELGQKIFTPGIRQVYVITQLDRPVTGYLYLQLSRTHFKERNRFLQFGLSAGAVGPMALGKELLAFIHPLLKINPRSWDWMFDYGISNEIGVNAHGSYGFSLLPQKSPRLLQITPVSSATLGTSFTNVQQSVLLQFGRQNAMHESGLWNARLQNTAGTSRSYKREVFAYYQPAILYQLYNATIQGGLFRREKGRVTADSRPFVLTNKVGAMFATPKYSLNLHVTYQSKEAEFQEARHVFGGLNFSYRFR